MVLYHAVSSYQLLEVMLHREIYHKKEKAILILPDFIIEKYPQYKKLEEDGFFTQVCLFPYMKIPHKDEKKITELTARAYDSAVPWKLDCFRILYVAGAHFYFSLLLIKEKIPFVFFEDAAGMLSRPEKLRDNLKKRYPLHSFLAEKYGLFSGTNPYISSIICLKRAQMIKNFPKPCIDFSVEDALLEIPSATRKKIIRFFLKRRIWTFADTILLTQNFSNLGEMTMEEQTKLYKNMEANMLKEHRLVIKKHPDDMLDYQGIFPKAKVIRQVFPSELLPYVFWKRPEIICTVTSTGCENLGRHFTVVVAGDRILPGYKYKTGRKEYV